MAELESSSLELGDELVVPPAADTALLEFFVVRFLECLAMLADESLEWLFRWPPGRC